MRFFNQSKHLTKMALLAFVLLLIQGMSRPTEGQILPVIPKKPIVDAIWQGCKWLGITIACVAGGQGVVEGMEEIFPACDDMKGRALDHARGGGESCDAQCFSDRYCASFCIEEEWDNPNCSDERDLHECGDCSQWRDDAVEQPDSDQQSPASD